MPDKPNMPTDLPVLAGHADPGRDRRLRRAGDRLGQLPPAERVAVFDNDGTLWSEKPMPVQAEFLFRRLAEQA